MRPRVPERGVGKVQFQFQHGKTIRQIIPSKNACQALAMPQRMEDAMIRFMSLDKIAAATRSAFADIVAQKTWEACAWNVKSILSPYLAMGSDLTNTSHDLWHDFAKQSGAGQLLAVKIAGTVMGARPSPRLC